MLGYVAGSLAFVCLVVMACLMLAARFEHKEGFWKHPYLWKGMNDFSKDGQKLRRTAWYFGWAAIGCLALCALAIALGF
ncbi:MAG: hypothetical protein HS116_14330 [Planctomycetes bacterium]|nr:hypothetical protein [Planctomycetota bacterium]